MFKTLLKEFVRNKIIDMYKRPNITTAIAIIAPYIFNSIITGAYFLQMAGEIYKIIYVGIRLTHTNYLNKIK